MFESEIAQNRFLRGYARMTLADIGDDQLRVQPVEGVNHPDWILGHLTLTAAQGAKLLGAELSLDQDWVKKYGAGSSPAEPAPGAATKDELLALFDEKYEKLCALAAAASPEQASQPIPIPRMQQGGLTTIGMGLGFLLTGHVGVHLGQLSSWRRMMGKPPMF